MVFVRSIVSMASEWNQLKDKKAVIKNADMPGENSMFRFFHRLLPEFHKLVQWRSRWVLRVQKALNFDEEPALS